MKTVLEMKAELERQLGRVNDINAVAANEKRDLTPDELKLKNEALTRCEQLEELIKAEERAESLKKRVIATMGDPERPYAGQVVQVARDGFRSLGEQLQAIVRAAHGYTDPRLQEVRAASGMNETIPAEGGFLLQVDFTDQLIQRVFDNSVVPKACFRMPISTNASALKLPYVDESDRATGSRSGGVQGYWLAEAGEKIPSKPKLGQLSYEPSKLIALMYVTDELLQDAPALNAYADAMFVREFDWLLTEAVVKGSGAGQPLGFMNSTALVTVTRETALTITYGDLTAMWSQLLARGKAKAMWLINSSLIPALMGMTLGDAGLVQVYTPQGGLFGKPVVEIEQCAGAGTTGDICLVDLSSYGIVDKGAIQRASSIHVRFVYDESCFRWVYRIDGQPLFPNTVKAAADDVERSEFVVLSTKLT